MPPSGDRLDRAILATLQRDGRIANIDLADAVSLSPSACLRRVKALEASGIIEGYRAEISRAKAGLGLTAFIGLRVEGHSRAMSQQIEQGLTAIPAVVGCHVTSGGDDFMVEVAAQDLADYERVLLDQILAVPGVTQAHTTFAIRTVLSRGPVPLTHWRLVHWPSGWPWRPGFRALPRGSLSGTVLMTVTHGTSGSSPSSNAPVR